MRLDNKVVRGISRAVLPATVRRLIKKGLALDVPPKVLPLRGGRRLKATVPLDDLGSIDQRWAGIYSPHYGEEQVHKFIHKPFLEDASTYVRHYQNLELWKYLVGRGLEKAEAGSATPFVLDLGSGGGNSVFPLLDLIPQAGIVASDLSLPLLKILKDYLEERYAERSFAVVQLNAEEIFFADNQFDLIIGGAILHHLFSPQKTIAECARILKPGGSAIFFEPFETGHQVLALTLRSLLERNGRRRGDEEPIDPVVVRFFEALCHNWDVRKGEDKSSPQYLQIDDKWLFTQDYFDRVALQAGFQSVTIDPIQLDPNPFSVEVDSLLSVGLQMNATVLPRWVSECLADTDRFFTAQARRHLVFEGIVVLRKGGSK
jgi:ubiquinone/menaquinone biosynthesis C-methylase UbiE